ncbi:hydrogen peroxide-inducible genes activator [Thiomicrospira sp. ALE5]|uniref:hydrogen peroxide-inducible genes activator n=1 Tax=Thiomicrospira sp. ALE5 TaxID=748650 RepID=UPI0008E476B5|nr:hydrogen peroxide-inducible genes activator [Thiomicrospira sp. ALE5]SFR56634.1 LysR family transcriptional regulator, hydrogen peroxide-inducible genes activator [Thiomicrospira sp. ALE5]
MTLNELKYILAVAKERHFRKAAELCFVSQPTLSIAIKKVEEELGVTIFERQKNDILITPIGNEIVKLAEEITKKTNTIKELAKRHQNNDITEIKLGAIFTIAPYIIPNLITEFQQTKPDIQFIIQENYTEDLIKKLHDGELDFVILSSPFDEPGIETQFLYQEPFVIALSNKNKLCQKDHLTLEDLSNQKLLLLGEKHCFRNQVLDCLSKNHIEHHLQRTLESSSIETIRLMVASNAGVSILPCTSVTNYDNNLLTIRKFSDQIPYRNVILAWRKSYTHQKAIDCMLETLQKIKLTCTAK